MTVSALFNIPENERDLLIFSFHNQAQHRLIVRGVKSLKDINLTDYLMDPISLSEPETFFRIHQQAHADFTAALGLSGVDLTDVDLEDKEQLSAWVRLHGDEHLKAANKLGFG